MDTVADPVLIPSAPARLAGDVRAHRPRVLVIGDALLDGWLTGSAVRTGREAPVPVVEVASTSLAAGGAANVAANLAALGADVELLAVLGDDGDGHDLRRVLDGHGVRWDRSVVELGRATPTKRRLVVAGQPVARYDSPRAGALRRDTARALADAVTGIAPDADAVVVADYGLGAAGEMVRRRLARLRSRLPLLVVDAHDLAGWASTRPDAVTPSAAEAAALLGVDPPAADRVGWAAHAHRALVECTGAGEVLLTLDVDGAVRLPASGTPTLRRAPHPGPESQACGAGDTFVAAWTAAVATGADRLQAQSFAQAAADVVVGRPGTAVCPSAAVAAHCAAGDRGGLLNRRDLEAVMREHRRLGHRIVFTNGCFDVVHRGHVAYLRQARALGDVLVVALNGDASVSRLKGPQRPVNPLVDRAGVVGALDAVDLVTSFDEDTPVDLLRLVRPDVYAKGGDYTPQMLPETPVVESLGGTVTVLDYLSDHSTSAIVDRIRTTSSP